MASAPLSTNEWLGGGLPFERSLELVVRLPLPAMSATDFEPSTWDEVSRLILNCQEEQ